jgi:hypothetical protein
MGRLAIIDGLRGYFLVFMLLNHMTFMGGLWLVHVNHAELGYVQDAQGFIFLSGLLVGLIYTRHVLRGDLAAATRKLLRRALELYAYAMVVILLVLVAYMSMDYSWEFWGPWLGQPQYDPEGYISAAGTLLYQPVFMDILPQYILYLLVSPWLIHLVVKGRTMEVATSSLLLWLAVQLGAHLPFVIALEGLLRLLNPSFTLRSGFNPLAWQLVFVGGLLIGATSVVGRIEWQGLFRPDRTLLWKVCLAVLAFFLVWRVGFTFSIWHATTADRFRVHDNRQEFSLIFLLNFATLAYAVAWALIAGPRSPYPWVRWLAVVLWHLFTLRFLQLLGQHSLQVYAYHVVLVYALVAFDWYLGPFGVLTKTLITLAAIASLALPARLHAMSQHIGPATRRPVAGKV